MVATKVKGAGCVNKIALTLLEAWNGGSLAAHIIRFAVGATRSRRCALGVVHQGADYFLPKVLRFHMEDPGDDTLEQLTETL